MHDCPLCDESESVTFLVLETAWRQNQVFTPSKNTVFYVFSRCFLQFSLSELRVIEITLSY